MASCNVSGADSGIIGSGDSGGGLLQLGNGTDRRLFCGDFKDVQYVYLSFSVLSALSCLLVFLTYGLLPRLRHGGYSSRVFIYRSGTSASPCVSVSIILAMFAVAIREVIFVAVYTQTHSPVFRTVLDSLIALGHIVSALANLTDEGDPGRMVGCSVLGGFNTFTLLASNMWYLVLAMDLVKAIRNPFR